MTPTYRNSEDNALTAREAEMLAAHDEGATFNDLAERFGYASANGAGNVVRRALTKVGRESEIRPMGGGGGGATRTRKVRSATDGIDAMIEQTTAEIDRMRTRLEEMSAAVDAKPTAIIADHRATLVAAVERAETALSAFDEMDTAAHKAFVAAHRERVASRVESTREEMSAAITTAEGELEKMRAARETIAAVS